MLFLGDVLGFWQTAGIALVIANVALLAFRKN
jgi:drug/metabolite transporter (DMT)-like permease